MAMPEDISDTMPCMTTELDLIDPAIFGDFEESETLFYYDGNLLFSFRDAAGSLRLAYWDDGGPGFLRYLVVPIDDAELSAIKGNTLPLLDALRKPVGWMVEFGMEGEVTKAWRVDPMAIPGDELPVPGVMLHP
jgi:hypothetical protein